MNRRLKTLIYLLSATILSGFGSLFDNTFLFLFAGFACVLFGVGFAISNYKYRKYDLSVTATIIAFTVIFIWGTLPFYSLGDLVYDKLSLITPKYVEFAFGMFGGFLLCFLVVFICYKGIVINWLTIATMIASPLVAYALVQTSWFNYEKGSAKQFSSSIIIFQTLSTLIIVVSMKSESKNENIQLTDESAI